MQCLSGNLISDVTDKEKAPSGRELASEATEGERETIKLFETQHLAGSFRHASRATFLSEEGFFTYRTAKRHKCTFILPLTVHAVVSPFLFYAHYELTKLS